MGSVGAKQDLYKGLRIEGTAFDQHASDEVVRGVRETLKDFGFEDALKSVVYSTAKSDGMTSVNGFGDLTITKYLDEDNDVGFTINNSYYGTGAHEAGHLIVHSLLKNNIEINPSAGERSDSHRRLEIATARQRGKLEDAIVKEASKRFGSNPKISRYASKNNKEKVAEAVSDVYANRGNAKSFSREIVNVMKDIKKGKFKPVIKVTNRQMGI